LLQLKQNTDISIFIWPGEKFVTQIFSLSEGNEKNASGKTVHELDKGKAFCDANGASNSNIRTRGARKTREIKRQEANKSLTG
jgi:hypothetical protein